MSTDVMPRLYIDLDRTLFTTDEAAEKFIQICATEYGFDAEEFKQNATPFYHYVGGQRYYCFFEQLESNGVDRSEAREKLTETLKHEDFLYPDGRKLLEYLKERSIVPTILSLGDEEFQTFKFSLVPELKDFQIICTEALKGEYFQAHSQERAILIDDKYVEDLPITCQGILIDRTQSVKLQQREGYIIINDLTVAEKIIS